jgi:polysaccharide chain length determinant protein (PEP-CTERM system associated)
MDELIRQLTTYLRGMWQRRWIGLAAAWLAAIVGVAVVLNVPDRHEASARVYVDTQSLLRSLMAGISIQPNIEQQVRLISRTLISRPNVEKLIRMADLDLGVTTSAEREQLIESLTQGLRLTGNPSTNLYVVSYRDPNPERARRIVQSLVTIFIESSVGDKRQDSRTAVTFVDEQIKVYENNLKVAEDRLKDFRLKYLGVAGRGSPDYFSRLAAVSEQVEKARTELRAAEQSRDSYKRELAGETPVLLLPQEAPSRTMPSSETDTRLAALRSELDALRRKYTDAHPDVIATKRLIEQLEEQRRQEIEARRGNEPTQSRTVDTAERNPVFQQLKVSLAEAEANVASLRAKLSSYEGQYAQLKASARLVPEVETEFAQLNRDYDTQTRTYETLLARRESAMLGEGVQDAAATQFRVIDPPRVSPNPVPPTRMTLLGLALVGALALGFAASLLASLLMPTFHDARSLHDVAKRPILGMVTMLPSPAVKSAARRSALLFASGASGLVAYFVAVFAFALWVGRVA